MPVDMFDPKNKSHCKFCGNTIYWIYNLEHKKWIAYDLVGRKPHPRCVDKSNLRIFKYK
jgi:hypothetical protein